MMTKDFLESMKITQKYFKTLIFLTLCFCALCLFIFVITYMRVNEFFSFNLLSFDNLWLFLFAFVYLLVFAFMALPFNIVLHYLTHQKDKKDFLFKSSLAGAFLIVVASLCALITQFHKIDFRWLTFCAFIVLVYSFVIAICLHFYENKNFKQFFTLMFIIFAFVIYMTILLPHHFETGFKRFLKTKGLSAQRVEIYLKDKQKFVIGELVFRDSKFAYVRFIDTAQGLNGEKNISKIVSIENISIVKD
ncbi:hypothetical protein KJK44_001428 [Campylobacter upsaliensis]|nr:hypothetical protein [Campylobacter upsaliensis]